MPVPYGSQSHVSVKQLLSAISSTWTIQILNAYPIISNHIEKISGKNKKQNGPLSAEKGRDRKKNSTWHENKRERERETSGNKWKPWDPRQVEDIRHPQTPFGTHCEGKETWSTCDCHFVASLSQRMVSGSITESVSDYRWYHWGGDYLLVASLVSECLLAVSPGRWVLTGGITKLVSAYWWFHWSASAYITEPASGYWWSQLVTESSSYWWCHSQWVATGGVTKSVSGYWWCHQVSEWLLVVSPSQWVASGGVTVSEWPLVVSLSQ